MVSFQLFSVKTQYILKDKYNTLFLNIKNEMTVQIEHISNLFNKSSKEKRQFV